MECTRSYPLQVDSVKAGFHFWDADDDDVDPEVLKLRVNIPLFESDSLASVLDLTNPPSKYTRQISEGAYLSKLHVRVHSPDLENGGELYVSHQIVMGRPEDPCFRFFALPGSSRMRVTSGVYQTELAHLRPGLPVVTVTFSILASINLYSGHFYCDVASLVVSDVSDIRVEVIGVGLIANVYESYTTNPTSRDLQSDSL